MQNIQFDPKDITVKPGETITFTNDESIPHDVHKQSGPGDDFSSGPDGGMQEGDTFELTLDEPGKYEYVCNVHAPGMAGSITVKQRSNVSSNSLRCRERWATSGRSVRASPLRCSWLPAI